MFGCAHIEGRDPLGAMSRLPGSSSSTYTPQEPVLTASKDQGKEQSPLPKDWEEGNGSIPKELSGKPLNISECIRIGLETNPNTRSTWQAVRSAAGRAGEEKSAYFPEVDLSSSAAREKQVSLQVVPSKQQPITGNLFSTGLTLNYLLFDGGGRSARVSGALADLEALGFQHNAALQNVALIIEQSYYALLASRWSQQVAEETVRSAQYHVSLSRARYDAGLVPRSDVLKAETEKADADLTLVSAKSTIRIAEGALASAMGLKVSVPLDIVEIPESSRVRESEEMDRLLDEAMRNRPELLAAVAGIRSKQAGIEEARSQYWPKINASAGYGWVDDGFPPNQEQWSIGLGLSFPLFTGFKRGYQAERARADTEQAKAGYVSELRDVELEVWTAYSKLREAEEAIQAAHAFVASAEESARLAEGEYKAGTGDIIALIDARTAHTSARNRLLQARLAWHIAQANFKKAVGRSLTSDIGK
jgi:outer membrane protein TolC